MSRASDEEGSLSEFMPGARGAQVGSSNFQQNLFMPLSAHREASRHTGQLPPPPREFAGRLDEQERLAALLTGAADGPAVVNLFGKPGVGKSALALQVCHSLKDAFPDAQLYADMSDFDPNSLDLADRILEGFVNSLDPSQASISPASQALRGCYRSLLSTSRILVLLDNAKSSRDVAPLIAGSGTTAILVTSRRPLSSVPGIRLEGLPVLGETVALSLLAEVSGRVFTDGAEYHDARALVSLCGGLPLAIRIAAGLLRRRPHWTLRRLVSRLGDEQTRLERLRDSDLDVKSSFSISYSDLGEDSARAFRLLGLMETVEFDIGTAASLLGVAEEAAEELLESLVDAQLLEAGDDTYRFHDLVRLYSRDCLRDIEATPVVERAKASLLSHLKVSIVESYNASLLSQGPKGVGRTVTRLGDHDSAEANVAILTSLEQGRSVLILGRAGSGKSTLVRDFCRGRAEDGEGILGLPIPLRQHPQIFESVDQSIFETFRALLPHYVAPEPLQQLIRSGRIVLLFDGLDEMPDPARMETVRALHRWVQFNPGAKIVVTTRMVGGLVGAFEKGQFDVYELDDLSEEGVRELAERNTRRLPAGRDLAEVLLRLPELSKSPLLLDFAFNLYKANGHFPATLSDVFEHRLTLAFDQWDRARGLHSLGSEYDGAFQRAALESLALAAFQNRRDELTETEALLTLKGVMDRGWSEDGKNETPSKYLRYLTERASVLREVRSETNLLSTYRFEHRTFLEYLAVQALLRKASTPEEFADAVGRVVASSGSSHSVVDLAVTQVNRQWEGGAGRFIDRVGEIVGELATPEAAQRIVRELSVYR